MKFRYALGIAVLLGILGAFWFSGSEGEGIAVSPPAPSNALDASRQTGGNFEAQQQESRQRSAPPTESAAGGDAGSGSATASPLGEDSLSASGTGAVARSEPHADRVASRNAAENALGNPEGTDPPHPSEVDKAACVAAANTLRESFSIFDLTPTQAVWYAWSPPYPHARPTGFDFLKERLLAPLCSGTGAFDETFEVRMEFVAVGLRSHARILVGDGWISDGTVISPFELDQAFTDTNSTIQMRRRQGIGPGANSSRESFEKKLAQHPRQLLPSSIRNRN